MRARDTLLSMAQLERPQTSLAWTGPGEVLNTSTSAGPGLTSDETLSCSYLQSRVLQGVEEGRRNGMRVWGTCEFIYMWAVRFSTMFSSVETENRVRDDSRLDVERRESRLFWIHILESRVDHDVEYEQPT